MAAQTNFRPFVSAEESHKELSVRALLLGAVFGVIIFGLGAGLVAVARRVSARATRTS